MIEHRFLCRHFTYHQQKLVLVLAAMRSYAKSLEAAGVEVAYHSLDDEESGASAASSIDEFVEVLQHLSQQHAVTELCHFEVEGKAMQARASRLHGLRV